MMIANYLFITTMAFTLQLSGSDSVLKANFFPPISLDGEYELALVYLETWNSIPNVTAENNNFYYNLEEKIEIPVGSYEINEITEYLNEKLQELYGPAPSHEKLENKYIIMKGNTKTLKSEILSRCDINFMKPNNIGSMLGFKNMIVRAYEKCESNDLVSILRVESLRINCNLIRGSYNNGKPTHTLHEFFPEVPPGYKVVEVPRNLIYLPVTGRVIDSVEIRICDQDGNLVDLRGENTNIRLHLRNANHL